MLATSADGRQFDLREDGTWTVLSQEQTTAANSAFRRAHWGISKAAARATEAQEPARSSDTLLVYEVVLAELSLDAVYIFVDDVLTRAKYIVTETYSNEYNYVVAFESLKTLLTKKYGEPQADDEYWTDDMWKDEPFKLGMAAITGDYSRYVTWLVSGTRVLLFLTGENYEASVGVEYASLELEGLEKGRLESAALDDL